MPSADLVQAAADIADWHLLFGLANPAATPIVLAALNEIATVEPPRSWPKEQTSIASARCHTICRSTSRSVEKERDRALRRAQNEAAGGKRKRTAAVAEAAAGKTVCTASAETA